MQTDFNTLNNDFIDLFKGQDDKVQQLQLSKELDKLIDSLIESKLDIETYLDQYLQQNLFPQIVTLQQQLKKFGIIVTIKKQLEIVLKSKCDEKLFPSFKQCMMQLRSLQEFCVSIDKIYDIKLGKYPSIIYLQSRYMENSLFVSDNEIDKGRYEFSLLREAFTAQKQLPIKIE